MGLPFNHNEINFIDRTLDKVRIGKIHYSELFLPRYDKLINLVNKDPYPIFITDGTYISIGLLGTEIINSFNGSFKEYLESLAVAKKQDDEIKTETIKEFDKSESRHQTNKTIAITAIVVSAIFVVIQILTQK